MTDWGGSATNYGHRDGKTQGANPASLPPSTTYKDGYTDYSAHQPRDSFYAQTGATPAQSGHDLDSSYAASAARAPDGHNFARNTVNNGMGQSASTYQYSQTLQPASASPKAAVGSYHSAQGRGSHYSAQGTGINNIDGSGWFTMPPNTKRMRGDPRGEGVPMEVADPSKKPRPLGMEAQQYAQNTHMTSHGTFGGQAPEAQQYESQQYSHTACQLGPAYMTTSVQIGPVPISCSSSHQETNQMAQLRSGADCANSTGTSISWLKPRAPIRASQQQW